MIYTIECRYPGSAWQPIAAFSYEQEAAAYRDRHQHDGGCQLRLIRREWEPRPEGPLAALSPPTG